MSDFSQLYVPVNRIGRSARADVAEPASMEHQGAQIARTRRHQVGAPFSRQWISMRNQLSRVNASAMIRRNSLPLPERKPDMTSSTGRIPARKPVKLSRTSPPIDLSPVEWQRGLRRQFGREQSFLLENLGVDPFFSEFRVTNPASKSSYRVAIRGPAAISARAPTMPPTSSEPASISNSRSRSSKRSVGPRRRSREATSRRSPNSTCATRGGAACISAPEPIVRQM